MAKKQSFKFPQSVIAPVGEFLKGQLSTLERRKKNIEESDPFSDESRVTGNAALDTEAEEQFGHSMSSAIKDQLDRRIIQTRKALARVRLGKYGICENCGKMIDTDRLMVYPDATKCINCENNK
jgi:RNA polymerase-binding transcription factor DksA